jgi:hypothetical protein
MPTRARILIGVFNVGIVVVVLGVTGKSAASSVLETVGAPGVGNGFTARVLSRGTEVTYYNPSLLVEASPDLAFGISMFVNTGHIHLRRRPVGVDVPDSVYDADWVRTPTDGQFWPQSTSRLLHPRRDTETRELTSYVALGIVRPLVNDHRLVFGFYALIPTSGFLQQDSYFSDEREQYFSNQLHFELLGDRLKVPTIATSIGGRLLKGLSWGAGIDSGMATRTQMRVYVPNAGDQRTLLIVPKIDTKIAISPFFGLTLRPWSQGVITATLHAPKSWDTNGENRVRFWDYTYPKGETAVVQSYSLTQGSEPLRIGLGSAAGGTLGQTKWNAGLQGVWTQWSNYRDRHGERPKDKWHDTVNVGLGWTLEDARFKLLVEFGVAPSPVPDQRGRSNYVDNTRYGASLGAETPFSYGKTTYAFGIYLQGQFMLLRRTEKQNDVSSPVRDELPDGAVDRVAAKPIGGAEGLQTNNPGYPGYSSHDWMLGAAVVFKVLR